MNEQKVMNSRAACYAALEAAWARDGDPADSDLVEGALAITMLVGQAMQLQTIIEMMEARGIAPGGFGRILAEVEAVLDRRILEVRRLALGSAA